MQTNETDIADVFLNNIDYSKCNYPLEYKMFFDIFNVEIKITIYRYLTINIINETFPILETHETDFSKSILLCYRNFWNDTNDKFLYVMRNGEGIMPHEVKYPLSILLTILGIELYKPGSAFKIHDLKNDISYSHKLLQTKI